MLSRDQVMIFGLHEPIFHNVHKPGMDLRIEESGKGKAQLPVGVGSSTLAMFCHEKVV